MDFVFKRSYTGPVKAVVLDWAGTTVDYGCHAPAIVFMEAFKRQGIEITMAQAREPMGMHKRDHIATILAMEPVAQAWNERYGQPPTGADADRMYEEFVPLQIELLPQHADLIPGTLEACEALRASGVKIGTSSGYNNEMMAVLMKEAEKRGYVPDSMVCATMVPAGRPAPWMCLQNAMNLGAYPMEAVVKIGDTRQDIYAGLNAGAWTIGLAMTGNLMGLTKAEEEALDPVTLEAKRAKAYEALASVGAHYVVDGIGDVPTVVAEISARLACGERP